RRSWHLLQRGRPGRRVLRHADDTPMTTGFSHNGRVRARMVSPERKYQITDPMTPNRDQPVEGSPSKSYTTPDDGNIGGSDTVASASAKANDVLEQLREAVEDFAEKATPVVRQFSAKAAEVVASAADK